MGSTSIEWQSVNWGPAGQELVLRDVSLVAESGQLTNIIGESGSGKSTLLRLGSRLIESCSGKILVSGKPLDLWDVGELRRTVVYVAQRGAVLAENLLDDLTTPLRWHATEWEGDDVAEALAGAGLEGVDLSQAMSTLSEGQLSRANLARALLLRPKVLLLDEPTAALDPKTAERLFESLGRWAQSNGCSLVCATHRLNELDLLPGRTFVLLAGRGYGPYTFEALRSGALPEPVAGFVKQLRVGR